MFTYFGGGGEIWKGYLVLLEANDRFFRFTFFLLQIAVACLDCY